MSAPGTPLPGILGELAATGHTGAALTLAKEWGGQRRYIPAEPRPGMEIVALVGIDAARALAAICGSREIEVPRAAGLGSLKRAILGEAGSANQVAQAVGCTRRYVLKVRALVEDDGDQAQGRLF
ncbi:hypothetical protein [Azospirillum sp. A39]|uniref:hypothetical protein n=1 Tax=Azospirillum sp. A39 TaxID=3462279 RepID=UPI00404601F8